MEAEELADGAARYIKEGALPDCGLAITGDSMVGQLTPARFSGTGNVTVSFRMRKPVRNCTVELWQGKTEEVSEGSPGRDDPDRLKAGRTE